jgi:hypothetical protein
MLPITRSNAVLSTSHTTQARTAHTAPRPSRAARPVVVAGGLKDGGDWLASGFLKVFTPPTDAGVNWKGTSGGYSVPPRLHETRGPTAQYASAKDDTATETAEQPTVVAEAGKAEDKGIIASTIEYISGALQRVINNNFKGDESEPDWDVTKERGWSGDIRKREKDG